MMRIVLRTIFFWGLLQADEAVQKLELLMPGVTPEKEAYYCTAFKLDPNDFQYIVEFTPNATKHVAHHIIVYGCEEPGFVERDTPRAVWNCGEMDGNEIGYSRQPPCQKKQEIIYAWAMDAPKLVLPEGVGFKVGKNSGINYLTLQVHYTDADHFDGIDKSGITASLLPSTSKKVDKRAGVLLLGTGGFIPPLSIEHMETACVMKEPVELHPFAFRTHTHKLGRVVSGWNVHKNNWQLIGRRNPQEPQMFYPVNSSVVIRRGDVVAARCTMDNTRDTIVSVGLTGNDEMCNFYIMYYVNGDDILEENSCFTSGPPFYYWRFDRNLYPVPSSVW